MGIGEKVTSGTYFLLLVGRLLKQGVTDIDVRI